MISFGWFLGFAGLVVLAIVALGGLTWWTLQAYRTDVSEMRRMYDNNILLVRQYEKIASDFKDVLMLVAHSMTEVSEAIRANQFCPMVRGNKVEEKHERSIAAQRSPG